MRFQLGFQPSLTYRATEIATFIFALAAAVLIISGGFYIDSGVGAIATGIILYRVVLGLMALSAERLQADYEQFLREQCANATPFGVQGGGGGFVGGAFREHDDAA